MIKFDKVDFKALVDANNSNSSLNFKSKIVDELNNTFTEDEKKWCIVNLYVYLNYHPTNDYPIDLDNIWKLIGFSHKKNAKRTLENNFIKDEDYKILLTHKDEEKLSEINNTEKDGTENFAAPYGARVYTNSKHLIGVIGLGLKNNNGIVEKKTTCKKVGNYDRFTHKLLKSWSSLTEASLMTKIKRSNLHDKVVSHKIIYDYDEYYNTYFKYIE